MTEATQKRPLGFIDATLYTIVMNTGLRWIAVAAAVGVAAFPLWLAALVMFFVPLAVATAELTQRHAGEGGLYIWVRDTFGRFAGFQCAFFYWFSLMPYFASIVYFLAGLAVSAVGADPKDSTLFIGISVALTLLVAAIQMFGLRTGKWLTNFGAIGGWLVFLLVLIAAIVIAARGGSATSFVSSSYLPEMNFDTAILWGTMIFAFTGAEAVAFFRNEMEGGIRTVLRVLAIMGPAIVIVYIVGTAAFLIVLPQDELTRLAGFPDALRAAFDRVGVPAVAPVVIAFFATAMFGQFIAWFGAGMWLPFAAGTDQLLPPAFAKRDKRTGAPVAAILLQAAIVIAIVVLGQAGESVAGAYDFLVNMSVISVAIPYLFVFAAWWRNTRSGPVLGAWQPPGGAKTSLVLAAMGLVATVVAIACTLVPSSSATDPFGGVVKIAVATLAMIALGILLYWLAAVRRAKATASA